MDKKQISLINKAFDNLYNVSSRLGIFKKELQNIENYMTSKWYKMKINNYDKCVFIKA